MHTLSRRNPRKPPISSNPRPHPLSSPSAPSLTTLSTWYVSIIVVKSPIALICGTTCTCTCGMPCHTLHAAHMPHFPLATCAAPHTPHHTATQVPRVNRVIERIHTTSKESECENYHSYPTNGEGSGSEERAVNHDFCSRTHSVYSEVGPSPRPGPGPSNNPRPVDSPRALALHVPFEN